MGESDDLLLLGVINVIIPVSNLTSEDYDDVRHGGHRGGQWTRDSSTIVVSPGKRENALEDALPDALGGGLLV
jgi:hypothetical protein